MPAGRSTSHPLKPRRLRRLFLRQQAHQHRPWAVLPISGTVGVVDHKAQHSGGAAGPPAGLPPPWHSTPGRGSIPSLSFSTVAARPESFPRNVSIGRRLLEAAITAEAARGCLAVSCQRQQLADAITAQALGQELFNAAVRWAANSSAAWPPGPWPLKASMGRLGAIGRISRAGEAVLADRALPRRGGRRPRHSGERGCAADRRPESAGRPSGVQGIGLLALLFGGRAESPQPAGPPGHHHH